MMDQMVGNTITDREISERNNATDTFPKVRRQSHAGGVHGTENVHRGVVVSLNCRITIKGEKGEGQLCHVGY
eukprot:2455545-Amphidinium_carterae.1